MATDGNGLHELGLDSPVGPLVLSERDGRITGLTWRAVAGHGPSDLLAEAAAQLAAYFGGRRTEFDLPLELLPGTNGAVQRAMLAIPFGRTRTYGEIAAELDLPAQSVGQACGANSLPILVPCHRVLGANGLGGFSARGGIETKVALLRHEGAASLLI